MKLLKIFLLVLIPISIISQSSFEEIKLKFDNNITVTYEEAINYYKYLDKNFEEAQLFEIGKTDIGKPLHLFILSGDADFDPVSVKKKNKTVVFINNGIHPGEPCGIDASIQFAQDILTNKDEKKSLLNNTVICIIPVYNIGGALNRSKYNRANQTTPVESGFRGNGRNLDLNRDFIKLDSKNAKSFTQAFRKWNPQVFLDTHTTNGSDHQYHITLIAQHPVSVHPAAGKYFKEKMLPELYKKMKAGDYELIPYIASIGKTPYEKGIVNYIPSPRFSTGYTNLFNNFSFMTENHIFKEFKNRVKSVYNFITALTEYANDYSSEINAVINQTNKLVRNQNTFTLDWSLIDSSYTLLDFKGYKGKTKKSLLTGLDRFYYDKKDPYEGKIKYFEDFNSKIKVNAPKAYIIPQAWEEVIERIKINNIEFIELTQDSLIECEVSYINNLKSYGRPYNGHFFHQSFDVSNEIQKIQFYKGDIIIPVNQESNRYIVNVLEPLAPDSFFRWNFFDSCLDQREYFSSYVWEETAIELLKLNPELKKKFEEKRKDEKFRNNHRMQLDFIYKNSPYYEKSHKRYPVARIK